MNSKDKKDISLIILDALDKVVIPQFDKMYEKFEEHDERFGDIDNSLTRIELKLDNEVKRNDEQSIKITKLNTRVLKLEKSKA